MPKKNDVLPLTIASIGLNGEGIAHLEGQVVFVPGGLPGEVCDVQILKVGRSAIWGKVLRVPVPSPDRAVKLKNLTVTPLGADVLLEGET